MESKFSPNAFSSNERSTVLLKVKWTRRELIFCGIGIAALVLLVVSATLLAIGIGNQPDISSTETNTVKLAPNSCLNAGCLEASATLSLLRNTTIDPCTDFYSYACSSRIWRPDRLKDDQLEFSVFHELVENNDKQLESILLAPPSRNVDWASEVKVKNFYKSCVDTYGNYVNGAKNFITNVLNKAGGWVQIGTMDESTYNFSKALKSVHVDFWQESLFRISVGTDWVDPKRNTIEIGLGGLTLYWWEYLDTTPKQLPVFNATKEFMRTVSKLVMKDSGSSMTEAQMNEKADQFVQDVFDFEFHVSNLTRHTLPSENPHDHKNRVAIKDLNGMSDQFDWEDILTSMFQRAGVTRNTMIVLLEADFLTRLNELVKNYPNNVRVLNNYFTWRLMLGYVTDLGWQYVHANRVYYVARTGNPTFLGVPKYCFNKIQRHFGDALGSIYIQEHLHAADKTTVDNVVRYLKQGLQDRLSAISWMEDPSKKVAAEKLRMVVEKIGYPDWMTNHDTLDKRYAFLNIRTGNYLNNLIQIGQFEMNKTNDQLVKGLDKGAWRINVWDVHGQYDMFWNELLVSAGMLQWPIYAKSFPKYYNFGSIGVPLAHELVHSVDEIGGYYYPNGSYHDWWTKNTTTMYNTRRACFEALTIKAGPYRVDPDSPDIYVPIEGTYVARELTAEIAALRMAFYAYKDWVTANSTEQLAPGVGLTNEQSLFLSYAQTQCYVRRDEYAISRAERKIIPEDKRLNQALAHTPEFAKTFQCKPGAKMVAEKTCEVF